MIGLGTVNLIWQYWWEDGEDLVLIPRHITGGLYWEDGEDLVLILNVRMDTPNLPCHKWMDSKMALVWRYKSTAHLLLRKGFSNECAQLLWLVLRDAPVKDASHDVLTIQLITA